MTQAPRVSPGEAKTCLACGEEKPLEAYHKHSTGHKGRHPRCIECRQAGRKKQYCSETQRDRNLRQTYGIGRAKYEAQLAAQDNGCAICGATTDPIPGRSLPVDHCHTTGALRGILCSSCNHGLGKFFDNPDLLRAAADYLENPPWQ